MTKHRIILVREWDTQVAASGCCGRLGGQDTELGDAETFAANRSEMEAMGEVYRALRAQFSKEEVEIEIVDPRNAVWLVPAVFKDARRRGLSLWQSITQIGRGVSYNSVVVDGKVLFSGRVPPAEDAVAAAKKELEMPEADLARV